MKAFIALSTVIALAAKSSATCWSEKLGYLCCSSSDAEIIYTDKDGNWSIENYEWCGIPKAVTCWSETYGYPCCKTTNKVVYTDEDGKWGVEDKKWCGIIKKEDDDEFPGPEQVPLEGSGNPFKDAEFYINPYYTTEVDAAITKISNASLIAKAEKMKEFSNAIWLDSIKNMNELLESSLNGALAQQESGYKKVLTVFVVYNLPGRDCHALASNGELLANDADFDRYKSEYIDVIEGHLKTYKSQPVVLIVEPNSLTNLVTNLESTPACSDSEKYYREGNAYLIKKFGVLPHVALYLDIGHAYLLGWDDTREKAARLYHDVIRSGAPGNIRGFADNIGGFVPWDDPNLSNGPETEWNPCPDEKRYLKAMYSDFVSAGIHSVKFVTDTSHNGKKFDYSDRELWCKSTSAGVGARPMAIPITTIDYLDAFYWIKPFGNVSELPNQSSFDNVCKDGLEIYSSDTWSQKVFEEGIKNANPPL
ncbi:glycoside hydrolase family 6 protein [Neocallimastix lanati (nom. inval.)]|jgi:cellulose 1,4-beta-cellobiosidase|nr:glycoside hydrolase family 6 protein [Neocallimastix sp. JGI-2020a]